MTEIFLDGRVKVMKGGSIEIDDKILDFNINNFFFFTHLCLQIKHFSFLSGSYQLLPLLYPHGNDWSLHERKGAKNVM